MSAAGERASAGTEIAVAVVERDGEFLIGLRPAGAALAGFWEFPGGKIADGESPAQAARRECLEETGLAVRVTGSYPTAVHDYEHGRVRIAFFACAPVEQVRPLPGRFRWVPAARLMDYRFPPANDELLRQLATGAASAQRAVPQ